MLATHVKLKAIKGPEHFGKYKYTKLYSCLLLRSFRIARRFIRTDASKANKISDLRFKILDFRNFYLWLFNPFLQNSRTVDGGVLSLALSSEAVQKI